MAIFTLRHSSIGKTTHRAGTAAAHLRYIANRHTCSVILAERMPQDSRKAQRWLNQVEACDRKNARIMDKVMVCLPRELYPLQRLKLLRQFCERSSRGRISWFAAIHDQGKDAHNPHAHIVFRDRDPLTSRRVVGFSEKGSTDWVRLVWEQELNSALERAGCSQRVTRHRTIGEDLRTHPRASGSVLEPLERGQGGFAPANP